MTSTARKPVAYVVLAHCASDVLAPLIEAIYNRRDVFVVHLDAKSPFEARQFLTALARTNRNIEVVRGSTCSWGGFSLVDATLRAIDTLLASGIDWSHLLLLSERHYPLRETVEIASRLEEGVSYLEFTEYGAFYPRGKRDIEHRFSRHFQEVEGVGSFFRAERSDDLSHVVHANQWLILSRTAAVYIAAQFRTREVRSFFASSLLPDETAFPTVLMGGSEDDRGRIQRAEPTFVAWPHRTDNGGMIASRATFEAARASDALFVRKRPPSMADLTEFAITGEALAKPGWYCAMARDVWRGTIGRAFARARVDPTDALARRADEARAFLAAHLAGFELCDHRDALPTTTIHLSLRQADWLAGLRVCVVSYTLKDYAVILVAEPTDPADPFSFEERRLGAFRTHKLKVRIAGLAMSDQVECPLTGSGLVQVAEIGRPREVVDVVREAACHAATIPAR